MGIDVKDLPPSYQAQALKKYVEQERRKNAGKTGRGKSKYHNQKDQRAVKNGEILRFDSKKEARRYDELMALLRAGEIRDLRLQEQFTLQEAYTTPDGKRVRAIRYQADFTYHKKSFVCSDGEWVWALVVEDVKSRATRTREYLMKKKLMQERFGINIEEI